MKLPTNRPRCLTIRTNWTPLLLPAIAGVSAFSLAAIPANDCHAAWAPQEVATESGQQDNAAITNVVEFREALKENGPEAVTPTLKAWMEEGNAQVYAATAGLAMHHLQNGRDFNAATEVWLQGFDHFYGQVENAATPSATDLNGLSSTAMAIASYSQQTEKYKSTGHQPLLKALDLLLPLQKELQQADETSLTVVRLAQAGNSLNTEQFEEHMKLLSDLTQKWFEENPEHVPSNIAFLQTQAITNSSQEDLMKLYAMVMDKFPADPTIFNLYQSHVLSTASRTLNSDPTAAAEMLDELKAKVDETEALTDSMRKRTLSSIDRTIARVEPALKRLELVGKPAPAFDAEAWVNGEAVNLQDLKGKVVLLDFWAVWCGPCIATFPHLQEWHEEYGDKGLVIVGVTSKYNYSWDEETNRASRGEEQTMDEEIAMLEKFLAHHQLQHRSMVNPADSKMKSEYGVTGIPQAVLIDQSGLIRMIRVGSGSQNAEDLHGMIETLLKE